MLPKVSQDFKPEARNKEPICKTVSEGFVQACSENYVANISLWSEIRPRNTQDRG